MIAINLFALGSIAIARLTNISEPTNQLSHNGTKFKLDQRNLNVRIFNYIM